MELYREAENLLTAGEAFVLAVMTDNSGSTPRESGTGMIIRKDGSIIDTIGGGGMEANVIRNALEVIAAGKSKALTFDLYGSDVTESDQICGGMGSVALYLAQKEDKPVFSAAVESIEHNRKGYLVLAMEGDAYKLYFVSADKTIIEGRYPASGIEGRILDATTGAGMHTETGDGLYLFIMPVHSYGTVYLFGAGHVALETARAARIAGFRTVVIDDRKEYANSLRFPDSTCIVPDSMESLPELKLSENDYVVILTRGHIYDRVCLEWSLKTAAGYIGMIGSRRKREMIYEALGQKGVTRQQLDFVHSPIGIKIGAQSPGELAISIVAELIQVRAAKEQV
ncbi:MAG: XdhC family protein [Clostridiales bacterium]|nr:XdhC family protein [Clostridiales bacterium]